MNKTTDHRTSQFRKTKQALYGRRWRKARANYLTANPLCVFCQQGGRITPATELDHIQKHNGDLTLFWDERNWQGLCADHHRSTKSRMERSGKDPACDVRGYPLKPNKYWR